MTAAYGHLTGYARKYINCLENYSRDLEEENDRLRAQLEKNSKNSHLPPSRDLCRPKPKSLREPSSITGRKQGAQPGHPGQSLKMARNPSKIVRSPVCECTFCGSSLKKSKVVSLERRQVFDLPAEFKIEVTEYQVETRNCKKCGQNVAGIFPNGIHAPVQYGTNIQALAAYLMHVQMLPYNRVRECLNELFGVSMGHGTIAKINQLYYGKLEYAEAVVKEHLSESNAAHFDETGLKNNKEQNWLHVSSTEELTHYAAHKKRGSDALKEIGILENFTGRAVHDNFASYFQFNNCKHAVCNAHHLRELTFVHEELKEPWALKMKTLLIKMNQIVHAAKARGKLQLTPGKENKLLKRYLKIIEEGLEFHSAKDKHKPPARGRTRQSVGKNLLDRLKERRAETLAFMHDFSIPFTNNQAERDIRMAKLKQKVSGTFRSSHGPKEFARIRGYVSTARKQNWPVLYALQMAVKGKALVPAFPDPT